jgi:hypothetical protein
MNIMLISFYLQKGWNDIGASDHMRPTRNAIVILAFYLQA